ncbi:MAG: crosslink repair DNA glycosylase YcaQ family protein [Chloroflexota bacterium]
MKLTFAAAQTLMIAAQGLHELPAKPATKADVLATIRRMEVLQIDTINVVARSPYFVLWSRLGDYESHWVEDLLAEGSIFEYWSHVACWLPIEDYPLSRRMMLDQRKGWGNSITWVAEHPELVDKVLAQVREKGTVRSADFERTSGKASGWWDWKEEKQALEHLHNMGTLMTAKRHNFQRHYALRESVLPTWNDDDAPSYEVVLRTLTTKAVKALGITTAAWVPDYFRTPKRETIPLLEALNDEGILTRAEVKGWSVPAYIHRDNLALAKAVNTGKVRANQVTLLSPFDPLVWDRTRAKTMFNFDYKIECYTPAPKRRYGYFTLPILRRNALIGRLDAKAHRKDKLFEVKALHLEPGIAITDDLIVDLVQVLQRCAHWHKTPEVIVRLSDPAELAELVNRSLNASS